MMALVMKGLLVDQAVGEGGEVLVGGVVLHQHPLAHGQRLSRCCGHNITFAGVDEHLHSTPVFATNALKGWQKCKNHVHQTPYTAVKH